MAPRPASRRGAVESSTSASAACSAVATPRENGRHMFWSRHTSSLVRSGCGGRPALTGASSRSTSGRGAPVDPDPTVARTRLEFVMRDERVASPAGLRPVPEAPGWQRRAEPFSLYDRSHPAVPRAELPWAWIRPRRLLSLLDVLAAAVDHPRAQVRLHMASLRGLARSRQPPRREALHPADGRRPAPAHDHGPHLQHGRPPLVHRRRRAARQEPRPRRPPRRLRGLPQRRLRLRDGLGRVRRHGGRAGPPLPHPDRLPPRHVALAAPHVPAPATACGASSCSAPSERRAPSRPSCAGAPGSACVSSAASQVLEREEDAAARRRRVAGRQRPGRPQRARRGADQGRRPRARHRARRARARGAAAPAARAVPRPPAVLA